MIRSLFFGITVLSFALFLPSRAFSYYTNMPASVVVGQGDFTGSAANQGGSVATNTLQGPNAAITVGEKLIVADLNNNRVLIYNRIPTSNNASADVVIGQPDFVSNSGNQGNLTSPQAYTLRSPNGLASNGTNLLISDGNNHRVLIYNRIPTSNNASADVVLGQDVFTTRSSGDGATFNNPQSVVLHGSKVIVSDLNNHRVLIWNTIPSQNARANTADVVIGQTNTTNVSANQGGSAAANTLSSPVGIATTTDGKLLISEYINNRILVFNSIPTSNNASADLVIGQQNFTSNSANQGGSVAANTLGGPRNIMVDENRLFVSDSITNNRILIFNSIPTSNNASADLVIGQQNFTSNSANQATSVGPNTLNSHRGIHVSNNKLFVSDFSNSRLLIFNNVISSPLLSLSSVEELNSGSTGVGGGDWEGRLRMVGSVTLGERGRYTIQSVKASVNGEGFNDVTELKNSRENSNDSTIWDFSLDFSPWVSNNTTKELWIKDKTLRDSLGYTVLLKASSYNADTTQLFYFSPFKLNSVVESSVSPTFSFAVNKSQWNRVKENLQAYEIHTKRRGGEWKTFLSNIPVFSSSPQTNGISTFDTTPSSSTVSTPEQDNYKVTYNSTSGEITVSSTDKTKTLLPGEYQIKVVALDKWGNRQSSNTLSKTIGDTSVFSSLIPDRPVSTTWFPLQITKISNTNLPSLLSTTNQLLLSSTNNLTQYSNPSTSYTNLTNTLNQKPTTISSSSVTPTISGIASYPSTVTLIVSNTNNTNQTRTYTTKTLSNSTFSVTPTLYPSSYLDLYVEENEKFNYLRRVRVE